MINFGLHRPLLGIYMYMVHVCTEATLISCNLVQCANLGVNTYPGYYGTQVTHYRKNGGTIRARQKICLKGDYIQMS
jgi:hypothetical protein